MIEFEKWMLTSEGTRENESFHTEAEAAWKAALEWVKEKLNCEIKPGDVEYFVDKELRS